ncbi:MAG: hypothetical protein ACK4TN_05715, partial [Brevinematales bacterium]
REILNKRTREIDSYLDKVRQTYLDDYQELLDKSKSEIIELEDTIREFRQDLATQQKTMASQLRVAFEAEEKQFQQAMEKIHQSLDALKKKSDQVAGEVDREVASKLQAFQKDLESTLRSYLEKASQDFLKRRDEYMVAFENLDKRLSEQSSIFADMEKQLRIQQSRVGELPQQIEQQVKTLLTQLSEEVNKAVEVSRSSLEEKIRVYFGQVEKDMAQYTKRSEDLKNLLLSLENQAVQQYQKDMGEIENSISRKISVLTGNVETLLQKTKEEVETTVSLAKNSVTRFSEELKGIREDYRESIQNEYKDLVKKLKEIEARYDAFIKKTQLLERAEVVAEKSEETLNTIRGSFQELEEKRRALNDALRTLEGVQKERRELDDMLNNLLLHKKESLQMKEVVERAMEKAKETQALLAFAEQQNKKAEEMKRTLEEAMKLYADLHAKFADLEKKRDIVVKILSELEETKESFTTV